MGLHCKSDQFCEFWQIGQGCGEEKWFETTFIYAVDCSADVYASKTPEFWFQMNLSPCEGWDTVKQHSWMKEQ